MRRLLALLCSTCTVLLSIGCESGDRWPRIAVHGNVTVKEVPNPEDVNGTITFLPVSGVQGPAATTGIVGGSYEFDRNNGPIAGPYQAVLKIVEPAPALDGKGIAKHVNPKTAPTSTPSGMPMPEKPIYLPDKKVTVQVPSEKPFELDFDLK